MQQPGPFLLPTSPGRDAAHPPEDARCGLAPQGGLAGEAGLPPSALTCLFRNNSDEDSGKPSETPAKEQAERLSSTQRKTAHALYMNVAAFVMMHGLERCGFLTITFAEDLTWEDAERRFNNYMRRVLGPLFRDRIKVLEFTKRGRPHFHVIVLCSGDIREGFNFNYHAQKALENWLQHERPGSRSILQEGGSLNANALLRSLWVRIRSTARNYGIGICELAPIQSCAEAVGRYVGGYMKKSIGGRQPEHKGARMVSYSRGFARAFKGGFSWVEGGGRQWRRNVESFALSHGCADLDELRGLFGPKWAYHHRETILRLHEGVSSDREGAPIQASEPLGLSSEACEATPPRTPGDSERGVSVASLSRLPAPSNIYTEKTSVPSTVRRYKLNNRNMFGPLEHYQRPLRLTPPGRKP